jgi:hypothetical protein
MNKNGETAYCPLLTKESKNDQSESVKACGANRGDFVGNPVSLFLLASISCPAKRP